MSESEQREDGQCSPWEWPQRHCLGDDTHGDPPFQVAPGGPLPRGGGLLEHVVEVVGDPRRRELGHELRDGALEALEGGHANCPFGTGAWSGSASARAERMSDIDR